MAFGRHIIVTMLVLLLSVFKGAFTTPPLEPTDQPTNPCAFTLCIQNTTCLSRPDPSNCHPQPNMTQCPQVAMCVPNGVVDPSGHEVGAVCGKDQWCKPGYTCEFVYPFCPIDVDPCFPVLACVPHGQPNRPIER